MHESIPEYVLADALDHESLGFGCLWQVLWRKKIWSEITQPELGVTNARAEDLL